jgi:type IV secretory pathway VirB2 component (pilin)
VITQHLSAPPPLVGNRRIELAAFDDVITKAMAKTPDERYASCTDFASALAAPAVTATADAASPTEVIAAPTKVIAAPQRALPKPRSSWRGPATVLAALVAVALVGLAALVGIRMIRGQDHPPGSAPLASVPPSRAHTSAPPAPAIKLSSQVTDQSGVLGPLEYDAVNRAVTKLLNARGTRLWVVYVNDFGGLKPFKWAEDTMRGNAFTENDAILAIATDERAFSFRVPNAITTGTAIDVEGIRRERIQPAVFRHEWTRAAVAAANGLELAPN